VNPLKNGAVYSVLLLGFVMLAHGFGITIPEWLAALSPLLVVGYFLWNFSKQSETASSSLFAAAMKRLQHCL